jgi:hypothetical protein
LGQCWDGDSSLLSQGNWYGMDVSSPWLVKQILISSFIA